MKSIDEISKNPKNSVRVRIKFNLYIYFIILLHILIQRYVTPYHKVLLARVPSPPKTNGSLYGMDEYFMPFHTRLNTLYPLLIPCPPNGDKA